MNIANPLAHSPTLGRTIRTGDATDLGVPTDELVRQAIEAGAWDTARQLGTYLVEEAGRIFTVLLTWQDSLLGFGADRIADWPDQLAALERAIGAPPPEVAIENIATASVADLRSALQAEDRVACTTALAALRTQQWQVHDDLTDWVWGMLSVFQRRLGEDAMEEVYRETQESWVTERYRLLPDLTQREKFELTIEGMRAHFSGPAHRGAVEVTEDEEKWVLAFDPCGSGGRMRRGDPVVGQTSRMEPPYGFDDANGAHDWTWQQEGVCLYCAHCSFVNEIFPIEQTGAPLRVTEYPQDPHDQCRWTVYKREEAIPDWAYERVGKTPPRRSDP